MAGHSHWAGIKHKKAAADAKRAKIFTRIARDLATAARLGGGDAASNASLRAVLDKARAANMPKDQIDRAIKRGTGELKGEDYVERVYEGYAAGGVAVLVQALTDNPTRTITILRTAFGKYGGNVGTDGSVAWMFKNCGILTYPATVASADTMLEAAIDAGADDVISDTEAHVIYTAPADFAAVTNALQAKFGVAEEALLTYEPTTFAPVESLEIAQKVQKLVEVLEADDDVQTVVVNMQVGAELAEQLT